MHDFLTRGGPSSPMHRALLAEAADDLTAPASWCWASDREADERAVKAGRCGPAAQVHAGAGMAASRAAKPVGGVSGVEGGIGSQTAPDPVQRSPDATQAAMRAGVQHYVVMDGATADALMLAARVYVGAVWDQAVTLAIEGGPMPLVVTEPWMEEDVDYRAALMRLFSDQIYAVRHMTGSDLDRFGRAWGRPRAHLVLRESTP